jgi:hypothetical protein
MLSLYLSEALSDTSQDEDSNQTKVNQGCPTA